MVVLQSSLDRKKSCFMNNKFVFEADGKLEKTLNGLDWI